MSEAHTSYISDWVLDIFRDMHLGTSLSMVVPELILTATICGVVFYDMFFRREDSFRSGILALMGTGGALIAALAQQAQGASVGFSGSFVFDGLTRYFRIIFLLTTVIVILQSLLSREIDRYRQGEYYGVLLTATLAISLLVGSGNIIIFFIALETLSLCSYILVGYSKGTRRAAEASIKYLLYGSLVSGVLLFGLSYMFGLGQTAEFPDLFVRAFQSDYTLAASIGLLMVLCGLFFKTSVVPFHMWTPDVYQGAPSPFTGYLSVASKAAGFAALMRIVAPLSVMPELQEFARISSISMHIDLGMIFWILAVATMTLGNFAALKQTSFKRLLAYSSIAHAGYMLMAFTNFHEEAQAALLSYIVIYVFMNLGFFLTVIMMENENNGSDLIADFAGYGRKNPLLGCCLVVILISLIGLPPTAGFIAKFKLFGEVMVDPDGGLLAMNTLLVVIALLNSVVSLAYYIRPAKVLFFDEPKEEAEVVPVAAPLVSYSVLATISLLGLTLPLIALLMQWDRVTDAASIALGAVGMK